MTNQFLVRYASGLETLFHSTCASVEHFCNEHFGSTWGEAQANGASVVMANADGSYGEPKADAPEESAGEKSAD